MTNEVGQRAGDPPRPDSYNLRASVRRSDELWAEEAPIRAETITVTNMSANRGGRVVRTCAAVGAVILLCAGCGSDGGRTAARTVTVTASSPTSPSAADDPTESAVGDTTPGGQATPTPEPAALPTQPPANGAPALCANTRVTGSADLTHPSWGPTRVFAVIGTGTGPQPACLLAVDRSGAIRWSFADNNGESRWDLATKDADANDNLFLNYNPGRYNGIIVLHPTSDGFSPIGTDYVDGPMRFYYADLQAPDASGGHTIKQSNNDCTPSCAGGTVTSKILSWNGSAYVG